MANLVNLLPGYGRFMKNSVKKDPNSTELLSPKAPTKLEPEIEKIISKVIPSEDPLDRPDFDVIDFINRNFPDEQSLEDIDPFISRLRNRVTSLDDELSQAVQEQSRAGHQASIDIKEAKKSIENLFLKIKDIRHKAEQSEVMVQEICHDIKQLDYAKRHLQATITALKRLHMLVTAVDQLEYMASKRHYKEAGNLIEAVKQLFTHFDTFTNVDKILELRTTVSRIRADLSEQIFGDFKAVGEFAELSQSGAALETMLMNLSSACSVIDALGIETREKLIKNFCLDQLAPYLKTFGKEGESFSLELAERRFPWFYRLLGLIEEKIDKVFPKHWRVPYRLCAAFCDKTRIQFLLLLNQINQEDIDVTLLLKALQKSLMFEKDISNRFEINKNNSNNNEQSEEDDSSAESIRRKYQRRKMEKQEKEIENELASKGMQSLQISDDSIPTTVIGLISCCFDPYMISYVALERKNMEELILQGASSEKVDREGSLPVLSSSVNMFVYIRNSVKRCTALTNGQTFFNLFNEFKECLNKYAKLLSNKLPKETFSNLLGSEVYRLQDNQEEEICFVLNTAEYCAETLSSLEEAIRGKIDRAFQDAVNLQDQVNLFHDVSSSCLKCLESGLEVKLEPCLVTLHKLPWSTWESVGDQSDYILTMSNLIHAYVPTLKQMLSTLYFNSFCDKFSSSFLPRFLQTLLKCKRINEMATQQLLLDVYGLKTVFLQVPLITKDSNTVIKDTKDIPLSYMKLVTKDISKIETILKLIGTPTDMLVKSFKIMWPEGTAEDLQQIMNVKGLRKNEQQTLLEMLGLQKQQQKTTTKAILGMEEKMSDMTGTLKKNMQNFAKGNVFNIKS